MEFAPSGVALSFEVTYDSPSLFVGMSVLDTTGPTPVLVSGPNLMANAYGNTYIGQFTPSAGKSYLIVKSVYTDGTLAAVDTNYASGSETIQSGGVDVSYVVPSLAQTNKTFVPVPNVSDALLDWLQPMIFNVVTKQTVNFQVQENSTLFSFNGVWQPMSPEVLRMKPEGQRSWPWFIVHSLTDLELKTDDVIYYNGLQFRVMQKSDYNLYGYFEYHLVGDYSGSGPQ